MRLKHLIEAYQKCGHAGSLRDLAEEIGVAHATLHRVLQGKDASSITVVKLIAWMFSEAADQITIQEVRRETAKPIRKALAIVPEGEYVLKLIPALLEDTGRIRELAKEFGNVKEIENQNGHFRLTLDPLFDRDEVVEYLQSQFEVRKAEQPIAQD